MEGETLLTKAKRWALLTFRAATPVSALRTGQIAKVVGLPSPARGLVTAPYSGRPCVAFRAWGIRIERSGREARRVLLPELTGGDGFWVEDRTGRVQVRTEGYVRWEMPSEAARDTVETGRNLDAWFGANGQHLRTAFEGFGLDNSYYEQRIPEGVEVAVIGAVADADVPAPSRGGYREASTAPALVPPPDGMLWLARR